MHTRTVSFVPGLIALALCAGIDAADLTAYETFRRDNRDLPASHLADRHEPAGQYYTSQTEEIEGRIAYLDSVTDSLNLTPDELRKLGHHHFVVTERLSFETFGHAFHDIYGKDLPVFVTTDAVLHALHMSYDAILKGIERDLLIPTLDTLLERMYRKLPEYARNLPDDPRLDQALKDIDLYLTVANSVLHGEDRPCRFVDHAGFTQVMDAIDAEEMTTMPLFSETSRKIDFSQFTVRGHYTLSRYEMDRVPNLSTYFQTMMWLGRIDFLLTVPPDIPDWNPDNPQVREDIQRMTIGAVMCNELLDIAQARPLLDRVDEILTFLVGEPDNLTPHELKRICDNTGVDPSSLTDKPALEHFQGSVQSNPEVHQKIMSNFFIVDPYADKPDALPVSFRLMGQRFIIDSYILANVVYDRIIHNGHKVWRPMPDPLDAMFVLGNDDALPLMQEHVEECHYAPQLATQRFLVDSYDEGFWSRSLYNVWLNAIRRLNPPADQSALPFFMTTVAWHQEKLNTQCASWAQLRHDNLLYAKQSYTGGSMCSFPHSYIEPYPGFYAQIASFARTSSAYFGHFANENTYFMNRVVDYMNRLERVMNRLEGLARKELAGEAFTETDKAFLQTMLFVQGGSGAPPFSGWYAQMYYNMPDAAYGDYTIADVHTQPTDRGGALVGKVLHVGTGKINLGVFIAPSSSSNGKLTAFTGPVFSYYEKSTSDFKRLTDEEWAAVVREGTCPPRPDWVNEYLVSADGTALSKGRRLPGVVYDGETAAGPIPVTGRATAGIVNDGRTVTIVYPSPDRGSGRLRIFDHRGKAVYSRALPRTGSTLSAVTVDKNGLAAGRYLLSVQTGAESINGNFVVLR